MRQPTIICDLDGVAADFAKAANIVHGLPITEPNKWNWYRDYSISDDDFWAKIHALGDNFYAEHVQPFPWKDELFEILESFGDFVIMSSPGICRPVDYAAKRIWCDLHCPGVKLIVGSEKQLLASSDRILIDDYDKNAVKFAEAGGHVCLFPQPWNDNRFFIHDRLAYVRDTLRTWSRCTNAMSEMKTRYERCSAN